MHQQSDNVPRSVKHLSALAHPVALTPATAASIPFLLGFRERTGGKRVE